MLLSRGYGLLNTSRQIAGRKIVQLNITPSRAHGGEFHYRTCKLPERKYIIGAEIMGGFAYWWVLWHMYHDYGHVFGEFSYPDPAKFTDEELGLPPEE